ncbi:helix-turn-helix transcriptional regulator [Streptomyces sp. NPDC090026]|uniref:helix-turn-helix transcriptional regulator n=1 Tax=Streptomyces sp. NPDC090026 TaxID=3365923 RepID=UPI0038080E56
MDKDAWERLGNALSTARRTQQPRLSQKGAAEALGVSRATVQNIEQGRSLTRVTPTIRAYARLVGWTDDSPEAVLDGRPPTLRDEEPQEPATDPPASDTPPRPDLSLPPLIEEELREGQVLASGVYDLTPEGSTAQLIVVVKGPNDATAEDMRRFHRAWRQKQRRLRELESEEIEGDS